MPNWFLAKHFHFSVSAGTPDGSQAREMHQTLPAGSSQREQYEQGHQQARQQVQSQLMHASWSLDDEPSGGSCSPYAMSPSAGRNSPLRASPRAGHASQQPYSEQQHWQQRQGSPQRACHSPANASAAADGSRNSSPKQRRLAEAMAAEAKAAAAAVLRGPPGSGSSASMLRQRAGEQQQSRHRTPERMPHSPARSPRHAGELAGTITFGVHFLSCAGIF